MTLGKAMYKIPYPYLIDTSSYYITKIELKTDIDIFSHKYI